MQKKLLKLLPLLLLFISCQSSFDEIKFVDNGNASGISAAGLIEVEDARFLESQGDFNLSADTVISGDIITVSIIMSLGPATGQVSFTLADNTIMILGDEEENNMTMYIHGPSFSRTTRIDNVSEYISPNKQFELQLVYDDEEITLSIDGKELVSELAVIPPAGEIRLGGYSEDFKIYSLISKGRYTSIQDFYAKEYLLDRAEQSVAAAAKKVEDDPNRPAYHFLPSANWNNDPNGLLYYDGYYHMFFQHNPYGDNWDWMHWGHARSRDLVNWERLPIALWPSVSESEYHCFSGSGYIMDNGEPILFYTSIGHEFPQHWAAVPTDKELIEWKKHPENPLIVMEDHGDQFIEDWRDPFLFREDGETYMVIGGHPEDAAGSIMFYKALNKELTEWDYLGTPFTGEEGNWECPNFFKVDDKYVLIYSPHGRVEYYTGTMDFDNFKFNSDYHGDVDNGLNYYAPNTLQKADGRRILFGWIPDFKEGQGWQSAITLPRDLSVNSDGRLIQKPSPEIEKLRGEVAIEENISLRNSSKLIDAASLQFELLAELESGGTEEIGFRFKDENGDDYNILLSKDSFLFNDESVELDKPLNNKIKQVRLFFDRTVIEIFINGGEQCATTVVYPNKDKLNFEVYAPREQLNISTLKIWRMKSIW